MPKPTQDQKKIAASKQLQSISKQSAKITKD